MIHDLQTWPEYWDAVRSGAKTFEVRKDDRLFMVGDELRLVRHDGKRAIIDTDGEYIISARITYVLAGGQFSIEPGFVVLGIQLIGGAA